MGWCVIVLQAVRLKSKYRDQVATEKKLRVTVEGLEAELKGKMEANKFVHREPCTLLGLCATGIGT